MSGLLKSKIKQTFVLAMDIDTAFSQIQKQFGASWQIERSRLNSDTIEFQAIHEGVEILGHLERWQGTESRLHLDGEVLSKVPYENWREWTGVICFVSMVAIWLLAASLPATAITFENLYYLTLMNGSTPIHLRIFIPIIFLPIPFLVQRYFTHLSPDIRKHNESLNHLASFVSEMKNLQNLPSLDTSRLEEADEAQNLADSQEKAHILKQNSSQ